MSHLPGVLFFWKDSERPIDMILLQSDQSESFGKEEHLCYWQIRLTGIAEDIILSFSLTLRFSSNQYSFTITEILIWLKLKKFLRGRIEDLRLGTKICENLCRFCLFRKDFVSKFDKVPTLNYYCYLYYFGSEKLYDWGQSQ
ncbi:hypothetical protein PHYBLDRAFT_168603 [Phycomyces blakesleeanus NRRL 1555(-)]|uniref:Uncharacterized protein n=1 Tax=Phycomyces blakesleeanus (strain ATCC 8743b / DSM 1359 / FGSC 10004 / NBRC 33097 / NRRL 1555) TaxID=763407 RepID=A0A163DT56_PHYB8|nr:hypothetical protein PHYBLDRAFT_168603 [Phycomyces blakesleeanus NRRL 1555(-)]OAD73250.1 hypothetical protein PHYBLDRAFT_168603 [Phycomyces blakesleeanus NRRL 1555(-)]|eukprot:XP_018291290.1 hypothetical protein PHYBLDRAFT_168603 [Phycomyces blakesleeanus NRRL 1555(-)]